ncbi:hypothetical protein QNK09_20175 [Brevibacillus agri]|uniref:hypothetical protein n=1 Tax=Brevibacillus agri TaxID=51101 RepID=UPI0024BFBDDF|nr:hypothetical protein [Brevibacillus agri]WHX29387.1 hypothetical protein QNK09_20175 [Brevibacillus agri]
MLLTSSPSPVRTWLAALLIACLCLLPSGSFPSEWASPDSPASPAAYSPAHHGVFHVAGYRPPSPIAAGEFKLYRDFLTDTPTAILFLLLALLDLFLFLIQKRIHWLKLMPLKFGSRFLGNPRFRTRMMNRKGDSRLNEIQQKRNRNDRRNNQKHQNFFHLPYLCGDRFVRIEILYRVA